jgi:nucleoside-diphosphate-sugar epimerase
LRCECLCDGSVDDWDSVWFVVGEERGESRAMLMIGSAMTTGLMGFDLAAKRATINGSGTARWTTTRLDTIVLAVKNVLLKPDETANRHLYIDSFTVSFNEVLEACEKATGSKWEVTYEDPEEQKKLGLEKMAQGDVGMASVLLLRYMASVPGHGMNHAEYKESANELLGLPKESLEDAIADILKA